MINKHGPRCVRRPSHKPCLPLVHLHHCASSSSLSLSFHRSSVHTIFSFFFSLYIAFYPPLSPLPFRFPFRSFVVPVLVLGLSRLFFYFALSFFISSHTSCVPVFHPFPSPSHFPFMLFTFVLLLKSFIFPSLFTLHCL